MWSTWLFIQSVTENSFGCTDCTNLSSHLSWGNNLFHKVELQYFAQNHNCNLTKSDPTCGLILRHCYFNECRRHKFKSGNICVCVCDFHTYINHWPDLKRAKLNLNSRRRSGECLIARRNLFSLSAAISCQLSAATVSSQLSAVKSKDAKYPPPPPAAAHPCFFSMQPRKRLSHWLVTSINPTPTLINHERLADIHSDQWNHWNDQWRACLTLIIHERFAQLWSTTKGLLNSDQS